MKKILLFFLCLSCYQLSAQSYDDAIDLIKHNKFSQAKTILKGLQDKPSEKVRSSLALTLLDVEAGHFLEGFKDFKVFFDNHPNPYPYFYSLLYSGIFLSPECKGNDDIISFCNNILQDPRANCTADAAVTEILIDFMDSWNNIEGIRKSVSNLHELQNWSAIGPFDNISGSGFNKDFGAIAHPEDTYDFQCKGGRSCRWFDIVECKNDRWQDMSNHFLVNNSVIYNQTFIKSEEDREVVISLGVSGSLKVWLNDYLICSENEERNIGCDVYQYKVRLQKGNNRLLLQTGSSEIPQNNFMVRFCDTSGKLLDNISCSNKYEPYVKAQPYKTEQIPFFAAKYFTEKVQQNQEDFIENIMLMKTQIVLENHSEASYVCSILKKMAPECTIVSDLYIKLADLEFNSLGVNTEKESIIANDPDGLRSLTIKGKEALLKENWDQVIELATRKIQLHGDNADAEAELIYAYEKKKDAAKMKTVLDSAYKKFSYNQYIAEIKYVNDFSETKDLGRSKSLLELYLKTHNNPDLTDRMINYELKSGNKAKLSALYKSKIDHNPVNVVTYLDFADALFTLRDYDNAMAYLNKAKVICPGWAKIYYYYAAAYIFKRDTASAIAMLQQSLLYEPNNHEVRKKIRKLRNRPDIFDCFRKNDIAAIYNEAKQQDKYKSEDAAMLLNDQRLVVYPGYGDNEEETEYLFLVNSQKAINSFKEYEIPYNANNQKLIIEKAELLKKDGSKVPAEHADNKIVYSSIAEGDAIHLLYRIENFYDGSLAGHFWNQMTFNATLPVQTSRFSVLVPMEKKFEYKFSNKTVKPVESTIDGNKLYIWEENDMPKIDGEPLMTMDSIHHLDVSSIPDWNYVASWYSDLSYVKTKANFEVKKKVKELLSGKSLTDLEKAKIIYNYIERNCNYSNVPFLHSAYTPQSANRTMNAKLGDCKDLAALFVSMATEAGLKANLVLVRTNGSGEDELPLPTLAFNHCIAQLHIGDSVYLVELTNNYMPFASLHPGIMNAPGIYIPPNGKPADNAVLVKLNTPNHPLNYCLRNSTLSFNDNNCTIHRDVVKTGFEAGAMRTYMVQEDENDRMNKFSASITEEFNKAVKVKNFKMKYLNELSDSLVYDYDILIDNYCNEVVGMKVFRMPWTDISITDKLISLVSAEKRKYPIDMSYMLVTPDNIETITVNLPAGKKLAEPLKDIVLNSPSITYSVKYTLKGNQLTAVRKMSFIKDLVKAAEYDDLKSFIVKMNQADKKEIVLK